MSALSRRLFGATCLLKQDCQSLPTRGQSLYFQRQRSLGLRKKESRNHQLRDLEEKASGAARRRVPPLKYAKCLAPAFSGNRRGLSLKQYNSQIPETLGRMPHQRRSLSSLVPLWPLYRSDVSSCSSNKDTASNEPPRQRRDLFRPLKQKYHRAKWWVAQQDPRPPLGSPLFPPPICLADHSRCAVNLTGCPTISGDHHPPRSREGGGQDSPKGPNLSVFARCRCE